MVLVEFHCHTRFSKDSLTKPEALVDACRKKKIDRVVVTDHNSIEGALVSQRIDPERVIIGEEIMTTKGELLAAFVQEQIPSGLEPFDVIRELRSQGAFISVSHPFDQMRNGHWEEEDLLEIIPFVDAIETFNARCMQARFNVIAQEFALSHNLAGTAGSDAHTAFELGRALLSMPDFSDAAGLRAVIREGVPLVTLSSPWVHFTSRYATWVKKANRSRSKERSS